MAARLITARSGWSSPAQITACGAMATIGVTCRATAIGRTALSMSAFGETANARVVPTRLATTSASMAMERVVQADLSSTGQLAAAATRIALGGGRI